MCQNHSTVGSTGISSQLAQNPIVGGENLLKWVMRERVVAAKNPRLKVCSQFQPNVTHRIEGVCRKKELDQ